MTKNQNSKQYDLEEESSRVGKAKRNPPEGRRWVSL
ncbi:unnamed protein product, partial [marine sediment metagenome]